jgi:hypothetical protein
LAIIGGSGISKGLTSPIAAAQSLFQIVPLNWAEWKAVLWISAPVIVIGQCDTRCSLFTGTLLIETPRYTDELLKIATLTIVGKDSFVPF